MRDAIVDALREAGITFVTIDGTTPAKKRQGLVDSVASINGPSQCAVLSITACSTGLNFTPTVTRIIFAELSWTPSLHMQAEVCLKPAETNVSGPCPSHWRHETHHG